MKLSLVFLAVVGLAYGTALSHVRPTRDIHSDLQDFINLIPVEDVLAIYVNHMTRDSEVQKAITYIQSDDFKTIFLNAENQTETLALLDDLESYDLRAYDNLNRLNDLMGIGRISPESNDTLNIDDPISPDTRRYARSVQDLFDEVVAVLPVDEAKALYDEKVESSPEFKALIEHFQSSEFKALVDDVRATPDVTILEEGLAEYNITVDGILNLVKKVFGWPS